MTRFAFLMLVILCLGVQARSQSIDWLETVIIEEFKGKSILVKQMDSLKQKCQIGREMTYCTESERLFDSKVLDFRIRQKEIVDNSELKIAISNKRRTSHKHTYRFLIDYDFDLLNVSKERSSIHYLKFDFIIIDLKTNEIVGRSSCENLKNPFEGFEYLLEELKNFQKEVDKERE